MGKKSTMRAITSAGAMERFDARIPAETKRVIEQAASLSGTSLTEYILTTVFSAAQKVIAEHETWKLNRVQSRAFTDALLTERAPSAAALENFKSYKARTNPARK